MKRRLREALEKILAAEKAAQTAGETARAAAEAAEKTAAQTAAQAATAEIKNLPRQADGLFDTGAVDSDLFEAARWVYPVYAYYETECNKKEGYPDLLAQMRQLDLEYDRCEKELHAGSYLDALIGTTENVSPQLYEYYRELADTFKKRVREAVSELYREGSFGPQDGLVRQSIARACADGVLLAEKYQEYC